jgi:hypothetical protein
MSSEPFVERVHAWQRVLSELNPPLAEWCKQPINIDDSIEQFMHMQTPLDRDSALRQHLTTLTSDLVAAYLVGSDDQRATIRTLLRQIPAVRYFIGIPAITIRSPDDAERLQFALACESMCDLRDDARDVILTLMALRQAAQQAGIDSIPYFEAIAAISSDEDRHQFGSMRTLLRRQADIARHVLRPAQ